MAETPDLQQLMGRIRGHFVEVRKQLHHIPVEEWGVDGKPLDIYVKPPTLNELNRVDEFRREGRFTMMAGLIVVRALDKDGKRIFGDAMVGELMKKADPEVVGRIAIEIQTAFAARPTAEEAAEAAPGEA